VRTNPNGLILFLCLCALLPAQEAKPSWSRINEGSITVYLQGDPSRASALLHSFAELRNALSQASAFHPDQSASLKVIAFRSESEYNQYRLNPGSTAYYQQTRRGEYIVLPDLSPGHREVSIHEFTHFVVAHSGVTLPLWLNEGIADFYSTFQISGDTVVFGHAVSGRMNILHSRAWLPLNTLFGITTASPYYSNPESMALFYSESWALAHMLVAGPGYSDRFPYFIRALGEGHTAPESLQLTYNKALAQIEGDLHAYVSHRSLPLIQAQISPLSASAAQSSPSPIASTEIDIALADLALTNPNAQAGVASRLASAASQPNGSSEAEEALGYLTLRQGKLEEARTHFRAAVDRNSSDPNVLFYLAHLDHEAGAPSNQVIPLLERALTLQPDLNDARLELALINTEDGNYEQALAALQKLAAPRPENAYTAAYTEAYCYAYTDKLDQARATARRAQSLAANDHDRAEIAQLLEYIDQQAKL
jgi:tetratricopeptide (TPR) repeat protein